MPALTNTFINAKSGNAFKNDKFYMFEKRKVLVMRAWPAPMAWLKRPPHGWSHDRESADKWFSNTLWPNNFNVYPLLGEHEQAGPCYQPMLPFQPTELLTKAEYARRRDILAKKSLFDTIPDDVRGLLLAFSDRKWHLLCLFARCPGAVDLGRTNPALAYALASNWVFRQRPVRQPIRAARSLVRRKQKHILQWLGFPGTEPVRRIMAKIVPEAISISRLLYLRQEIICAETRKALAHLHRINAPVLRLATDPKCLPSLTPRFLEEISQPAFDANPQMILHTLKDTFELAAMDDKPHCPGKFSSYARLVEIHDFLDRRLRIQFAHRRQEGGLLDFPLPPFMGTNTIRPILTEQDLASEGEQMDHCVGMYAPSVAEGQLFVYRVLDPIRATLSLRLTDDKWKPDQLYQHRNRPVDATLQKRLFGDVLDSGPYKAGDVWDKNQLPLDLALGS